MRYHWMVLCVFIWVGLDSTAYAQGEYEKSVNAWHKDRIEALKKENGWLNLAGLFWLKPGKNTFGADSDNDIVFPKGTIAGKAGCLELANDQTVTIVPAQGVQVKVNNATVSARILFHKDSVRAPVASYGNLRWTIIRRDDKIGIRLRDLQSPQLLSFTGIDRYAVDSRWKVNAVVENEGQPDRISITNVLGQTNLQKSAGKLIFSFNGRKYTLDALDEGGPELFVIFSDSTNLEESYPSGRFLSVQRPDANGNTVIDFNKAYNPPCAFTITQPARCPLRKTAFR